MKTMKIIFKLIFAVLAVVTFFSCDIPVALGSKLDISGPVVTITYPSNRKVVTEEFELKGTVSDDTAIARMEIKAVQNNIDFPRQWHYVSGVWEVSDDYGATWSPFAGAEWNGTDKNASWKVNIDMVIIGDPPNEGQYTFFVQAWDKSGFSDDNSYKTVVVIVDTDPPKVDVSYPFLYRARDYNDVLPLTVEPFKTYVEIQESDPASKAKENPSYLGKFVTQGFDLKWQADDPSDIYAVEISFYKVINDTTGATDSDYLYRFTINDINTHQDNMNSGDFIKPNGTVKVDLESAPGTTYNTKGDEKYERKVSITAKTTILVEMVAKDAAGNISQDKKLGYFIYWPAANKPWIAFADGMKPIEGSYGQSITANGALENSVFTVFPSKYIKATAYQPHGVSKVTFSIYQCDTTGGVLTKRDISSLTLMTDVTGTGNKPNSPNSLGQYNTIFPLEFDVPIYAGYYLLIARAYGTSDSVQSQEYQMLFRVNDITFPQFIEGPFPDASVPLFMDIKSNKITINGIVDDATAVKTLCMVWINPESDNFKAMSQLAYFRDASYRGWTKALTLTQGGSSAEENLDDAYDPQNPNRLWKLNFTPCNSYKDSAGQTISTPGGINPQTNRHVYSYSREIDLTSELKIGTAAGQNPLKSQIFLFRLENTAGRTTIITYAPQGDTILPEIKITNVTITAAVSTVPNPNGTGTITAPAKNITCTPGTYTLIDKFNGNETITINGTWTEDSIEILDMTTYFRNNFVINVNSVPLFDQHPASGSAIGNAANTGNFTLTQGTGVNKKTGTWRISIPVTYNTTPSAGQISTSSLKDTLVIDVKTSDIGGNVAQIGNSWLIQSDTLRLMRISSELDDGIYSTNSITGKGTDGKDIKGEFDIFLEFSKPVKLSYPGNIPSGQDIWLELSNGGKAKFKAGQTDQNSRQYFTYTIRAGNDTPSGSHLNVTGLYVGSYNSGTNTYTGNSYGPGTGYSGNYLFAWSRGSGTEFEQVRLTMTAGRDGLTEEGVGTVGQPGKGYFVRTLPTNTSSTNADYQYTLYAAKDIKIDTAYPKVISVSGVYVKALTNPGWYNSGDIYFSITFDEPVIVGSGSKLPKFPVALRSGTNDTTSAADADVRVNGSTVTFKYTIKSTDYSNGNMIYLSSSAGPGEGTITDLAGNAYPNDTSAGTIRALSAEADRRIKDTAGNGIYVETRTPPTPEVRVLTSSTIGINDANVLKNNVSGTDHYGNSTQTNKTLSNVYQKDLWLAIKGTGSDYQYEALEYSIDNGTNWIRAKNTTNTPVPLDAARTGTYNIRARQIDKAGNVTAATAYSPTVSFNWDSGALIERISSETPNGEYTNVTGRNTIQLTVYFRKPLFISGTPTLTLNILNSSNSQKTVTTIDSSTPLTSARSSVTFNYVVQNGDKMPAGTNVYLDITGISGFTARDGTSSTNGVDVSSLIVLPDGSTRLDSSKKFTVATGDLTIGSLTFAADTPVTVSQTDSTFHGINSDDGSYWTTLEIPFNRNIYKGTGSITITQDSTNYRLPAVMTEAQYNRIKSAISTNNPTNPLPANINIDTYYTKGTNGYINGTGSDTSTKYVLNYNYDPDSTVTSNTTGTNGSPNNTFIPAVFYTEFRKAEAVTFNINAAAVTAEGSTLKIRLAGSSALQVPGATYVVNLGTSGIVTDSLGNSIKDFSTSGYNATLRGVAKPFIRIKKTQDTISTQNATATAPRLVATQPMLAYARMDCRTPGSAIYYTADVGRTTLTGNAPQTANAASSSNNNWAPDYIPPGSTSIPAVPNNANNTNNNNDTMLASHPTTYSTQYDQTNGTTKQIELGKNSDGTTPTIDNVQGYQWWAAARATVSTTNSYVSEEVAYRTVISYSLRGANGAQATVGAGNAMAIATGSGRTILGNGDQIWIRGGDAILSSSIPGFPFTWADDWSELSGKRAGIRLMTLVGSCGRTATGDATATINNSLWRLVTWEMTTPAYVDFIRGIDTATDANVAWQFGPLNWAYQSDGWTSAKESYKVYVGKHRWCDTGYNHAFAGATRGNINFSGVINARPSKTVTEGYASGAANSAQ